MLRILTFRRKIIARLRSPSLSVMIQLLCLCSVWPGVGVKSSQNVSKSCPNSSNSSFTKEWRFSNCPKTCQSFVRKFVTKNFQKSPNLVTLLMLLNNWFTCLVQSIQTGGQLYCDTSPVSNATNGSIIIFLYLQTFIESLQFQSQIQRVLHGRQQGGQPPGDQRLEHQEQENGVRNARPSSQRHSTGTNAIKSFLL